jgi:Putative zinc-finger
MSKSSIDPCCSDCRANIPWLVNETLPERDAAALRAHLKSCSDCQADLEMHKAMRASVLESELTPIRPATKAVDIIGRGDRRPGPRAATPRATRLAAIAAGIAIFGVAIVVGLYPNRAVETGAETVNQVFETSTSIVPSDGIDYVLQIRFDENVSESERAKIAARLDGAIRWAVNDVGVYEVHVRFDAATLENLRDYEGRASKLAGVQSAKFTALQLPMR